MTDYERWQMMWFRAAAYMAPLTMAAFILDPYLALFTLVWPLKCLVMAHIPEGLWKRLRR